MAHQLAVLVPSAGQAIIGFIPSSAALIDRFEALLSVRVPFRAWSLQTPTLERVHQLQLPVIVPITPLPLHTAALGIITAGTVAAFAALLAIGVVFHILPYRHTGPILRTRAQLAIRVPGLPHPHHQSIAILPAQAIAAIGMVRAPNTIGRFITVIDGLMGQLAVRVPTMDGSGFYITQSVKEKKWGFEVTKYDRNLKKLWSKTETVDKGMTAISYAMGDADRFVLISTERPALTSAKLTNRVVSMDSQTGAKQFSYSLYDGNKTHLPSTFLIEEDGTLATAGMYYDGEKASGDNSDGIFFLRLDKKGQQVAYSSIDWDNGIQAALKATKKKFSIGGKPKVLFHEIAKDESGNYQLIAETFRKAVGAGTALAVLGGARGGDIPVRFTVMDFIIFNYNGQAEPLDINKIEKPYKSLSVSGALAANGIALAQYMKQWKMFTYEFQTKLPSGQQAIIYTNFEDAGLGAGKPYTGITTIDVGKDPETQKVPMPKRYTSFVSGNPDNMLAGTLRGKPGKYCFYVYDKKSKAILLSLEDISAGE